jgi:hypothetical protein
MNIKPAILIVLSILLSIANIDGQDKQKQEENEKQKYKKLYWGFYFDQLSTITFGQQIQIQLAPFGGYRFTKDFSAGLGAKYIYYHAPAVTAHSYGGFVFTRYIFLKQIYQQLPIHLFAHAEYDLINAKKKLDANKRVFHSFYWLGGGLKFSLGGDRSVNLMALWNIISHDQNLERRSFRIAFIF